VSISTPREEKVEINSFSKHIVEGIRQREVQALHAAISNRSWHDVEVAANAIRDKMDQAIGIEKIRGGRGNI
jgi:hypothetical protein